MAQPKTYRPRTAEEFERLLTLMAPPLEVARPAVAALSPAELASWRRRILAHERGLKTLPIGHPKWQVTLYLRAVRRVGYMVTFDGQGPEYLELSVHRYWRELDAKRKVKASPTQVRPGRRPGSFIVTTQCTPAELRQFPALPPLPEMESLS